MPRRHIRLNEPRKPEAQRFIDTEITPEIRAEMVTGELDVPEAFEGYIPTADVKDFNDRDEKMILEMSVHAQWIDWSVETIEYLYTFIRILDYQQAKTKVDAKKAKAEPKRIVWLILKWGGAAMGAAALSEIARLIIRKL